MKRKLGSSILLALCSIIASHAQISWNAQAGINMSSLSGYHTKFDLKSGMSYQASVGMDYCFYSKNFYLSPSIQFTSRSFKAEGYSSSSFEDVISHYKDSYTAYYLNLPIMVNYKFDLGKNFRLGLGTGPYLGYGIGGNIKREANTSGRIETNERDYFGSKEDSKSGKVFTSNRFDFGWTAGVTLDYQVFFLSVTGSWGITGQKVNESDSNKPTNNGYALTLGYRF